ncbi:GNAT family N-acetyltransferase [Chloroflexota bacterium]
MISASPSIREITGKDALGRSARLIRDSFRPVAVEFGLTRENCPTHPSFVSVGQLRQFKEKGLKLFGLFLDDRQVGFVAVEQADESLYYMEKLAVLPDCRHNGYGVELVRFVIDYIKSRGGEKLSIGIINEHTVLKDWYKGMGFKETGTMDFAHLPFTVCFMEMDLSHA